MLRKEPDQNCVSGLGSGVGLKALDVLAPMLRERSGAECWATGRFLGGVDASNLGEGLDKLGDSTVVVAALDPLLTREFPRLSPPPLEKTSRTLSRFDRVRERADPAASGLGSGKL